MGFCFGYPAKSGAAGTARSRFRGGSRLTTRSRLDNLTRLQVPGSYDVGWVRVTVTPGAAEPFAFELRVVPHWKYW